MTDTRLQELKTLKDAVEGTLGNINDLADLMVKAKRGQYKPDTFTCHAILDSITRLRELIKNDIL